MTQLLFSITFALSCTMFELIIFEIIGIMDQAYVNFSLLLNKNTCTLYIRIYFLLFLSFVRGRYFFWQFNLYAILCMVIIILPVYGAFQIVSMIKICKQMADDVLL